ncbi:hypothetical protein [Methanobrevibacter sp.]|uniref:hypothetical protein n=1 Tax=Methanobrevibacter sp. TaxID=66852 RepID=UPI003868DB1E
MKILFVIIAILILIIVILSLIIKSKNKTINFQNIQLNENTETIKNKDRDISNLMEEMEIEKKYNQQLAKKLADISCMSIDDVLKQLQK